MEPLHMDVPVLTDQQELIYISSVQTQDIVLYNSRGISVHAFEFS